MDVYSQAEDGIRDSLIEFVIPGWCVSTRPQMRNCASGNLEILRCAIAHHSSMLRIARNDNHLLRALIERLLQCHIALLLLAPVAAAGHGAVDHQVVAVDEG